MWWWCSTKITQEAKRSERVTIYHLLFWKILIRLHFYFIHTHKFLILTFFLDPHDKINLLMELLRVRGSKTKGVGLGWTLGLGRPLESASWVGQPRRCRRAIAMPYSAPRGSVRKTIIEAFKYAIHVLIGYAFHIITTLVLLCPNYSCNL